LSTNDIVEQPEIKFCSRCGADCSAGFADTEKRLCAQCAGKAGGTPRPTTPTGIGHTDESGEEWLGSFRITSLKEQEIRSLRKWAKAYVKFENDSRADWLVEESLRYRLLLRRNSIEYDGATSLKNRAALETERRKLNEVLTQLTNDLSELPRQDKGVSQYEQALTEAVKRYREARAVRLRETEGHLGQLSTEAKKMAIDGDLDPKQYEIGFERETTPEEVLEELEELQ
jgi:hypothetical protein